MGAAVRDHILTDDIQHGAAGESQQERQHGGAEGHREIAQQRAGDLHHAGGHGQQQRPPWRNARLQHGGDQHHALRQILHRDTAGDGQRLGNILRAEAHPGGEPLRQIMNGHGGHEQQHPVGPGGLLRLLPAAEAGEQLHPGHQLLQQQQKCRAAQDPAGGHGNGPRAAALQRRQDQSHHGGTEHNAGGKGHNGLAAEPFGSAAAAISRQRAQHSGAAHAQRRQKNDQQHETCTSFSQNDVLFSLYGGGGEGVQKTVPAPKGTDTAAGCAAYCRMASTAPSSQSPRNSSMAP